MPPTTTGVDHSRITAPSVPRKASSPVLINDFNLYTVRTVGVNLSIRVAIVWRRSKAKVNRFLGNIPPVACNAHEPTRHLPYEVAEMIITHLIHDLPALKTCSLTCRSWYTIAVPHIHHTLTLGSLFPHDGLKLLYKLHRLGLTPLVREIRVDGSDGRNWFTPQGFTCRGLRDFSAFANVHTLGFLGLKIYHFFPHIEHYFGHFLQTLRSIVLAYPQCTPQQLSRFLSLFQNLDDLKLLGPSAAVPNAAVPDETSVPFSTPKLGGRLSIGHFTYDETWTDLIASCGSLRFRRMELHDSVSCTHTLFEACAETLETLRFKATDHSESESFCTCISTDLTDGELFPCIPRVQSVPAQSPPIATSHGLGCQPRPLTRPQWSFRNGGVLDHHISQFLRACCCPFGRGNFKSSPPSCIPPDAAQDVHSQALQIGPFV